MDAVVFQWKFMINLLCMLSTKTWNMASEEDCTPICVLKLENYHKITI